MFRCSLWWYCKHMLSSTVEGRERWRAALCVRLDQVLLSHQLGLRVGDRVSGHSSLATAAEACSWVWRKFISLFICFSLRPCPGKISWQSCERSSWQRLDQDDVRQSEVQAWRRRNRWSAEASMWADGVWRQGWPMQGAEEQLQQTVQTYPRSLTQQDYSQAVQETGKAVKEGMGAWGWLFGWGKKLLQSMKIDCSFPALKRLVEGG